MTLVRIGIPLSVLIASAVPAAGHEIAIEVEPIVRMNEGEVAACGVGFSGAIDGAPFMTEFVLTKTRVGPLFRLTARYDGPAQLIDISLEAAEGSTAGLLPRPSPKPDGTLSTEGPIPGLTGSALVRSLMVSGGRLLIGLGGPHGDVVEAHVPGPFAQQIRAGYLSCAGDLERP